MPTVLIVDDSPVDRALAAGLLEKASIEVSHAGDGREALEKISQDPPDLVLTDLQMPHIDGLELVDQIRQDHPLIPVVLMTSKGSEEIAVESLRRGASSYVPKKVLAQELVPTIQSILAVAIPRRARSELMLSMTGCRFEFELANRYSLIPGLVRFLEERAVQMGLCDEMEAVRLSVALQEALVNALYHGNLELDSKLREQDLEAYHDAAEERAELDPYKDRRIRVEATVSRDRAVFVIADEGPGFDPATLPDPTAPPNLEKVSGRGVMLMRTMMDEVRFNEEGNQVTLVKRREVLSP